MRRLHLIVGLTGVAVFLGTGVYMATHFPALYGSNEALRYMYRANHVYLLLASLVNVALGVYLVRGRTGWRASLGKAGSVLALLSPALLCYAFVAEVPHASPERLVTALGVFAVALGVVAQLPSAGRASAESESRG
jgi:hypothetical protein